jgi:hypothetical protein
MKSTLVCQRVRAQLPYKINTPYQSNNAHYCDVLRQNTTVSNSVEPDKD